MRTSTKPRRRAAPASKRGKVPLRVAGEIIYVKPHAAKAYRLLRQLKGVL
jgi:hypothetical protein